MGSPRRPLCLGAGRGGGWRGGGRVDAKTLACSLSNAYFLGPSLCPTRRGLWAQNPAEQLEDATENMRAQSRFEDCMSVSHPPLTSYGGPGRVATTLCTCFPVCSTGTVMQGRSSGCGGEGGVTIHVSVLRPANSFLFCFSFLILHDLAVAAVSTDMPPASCCSPRMRCWASFSPTSNFI